MTKKQEKPLSGDAARVARVKPLLDYWIGILGLSNNWTISFKFLEDLAGEEDAPHEVIARTKSIPPYHKALIGLDRTCVDAAEMPELEHTIVHELLHVVLQEVYTAIGIYFPLPSTIYDELVEPLEGVCDQVASGLLAMRHGSTGAIHYESKDEEGD